MFYLVHLFHWYTKLTTSAKGCQGRTGASQLTKDAAQDESERWLHWIADGLFLHCCMTGQCKIATEIDNKFIASFLHEDNI